MKTESQTPSRLEMNLAFPDLLVKTHHGNVHLRSLIQNKRVIVVTNPSDMIPITKENRKELVQSLKKIKKLNFHLIGFNRNTFDEHLRAINWINSYLTDDLVFPVFYQPKNDVKTCLERDLGKEITLRNPVYFLDKTGCTRVVLEGFRATNDTLDRIVEQASRLVLSEQPLQLGQSLRDN
ncbi:redoxin domain-containing protein [Cyclobacterium xiamenense]|uniref:redoxin domain-containing protein n=1 Tax=Cyclobacterium xiamenense TaxID=1297121 RepID=UPI0012B90A0E|nr:redoxin domain-containing protein [Cyclobacterium xiamenense]